MKDVERALYFAKQYWNKKIGMWNFDVIQKEVFDNFVEGIERRVCWKNHNSFICQIFDHLNFWIKSRKVFSQIGTLDRGLGQL